MSIYTNNGYKDREDYLRTLAEDYGVPLQYVQASAELLGPGEDFDGLVATVQDMDFFGIDGTPQSVEVEI